MRAVAGQRLLVTDPLPSAMVRPVARWLEWGALGIILALGAVVRFARLDSLSLWLDEIYVVDYIRRPWTTVLGFEGAYDNHPPLYFAIVKIVAGVTGEANAARVVSAVAGTATIAVVFALTRRLMGPRAALLASLILALSPLLIWYSREGRMYAPAAFFVALSYYALLRFLPGRDRRWGVFYAGTLALAAYTDYSAFYALAPQLLVAAWLAWQSSWRALWNWCVAVAGAALLFAPWGTQVLRSIDFVGDDRAFLFVTRQKIVDSFYAIVGLPGERAYYWGVVRTPWVAWPEIRPVVVALVTLVLVLAVATLSGEYRTMLVLGLSLCFGTIAITALASYYVSPGYADRTVSYAVIGWAMLAGSAPFGRAPNAARTLGLAAAGLLLVCSALTLHALAQDADKEHYRELAMAAGDVNAQGFPVVAVVRPEEQVIADSTGLVRTAISIYEPHIAIGAIYSVRRTPVFWHVATGYPWETETLAEIQAGFAEEGFVRVQSEPFPPVMALDLYVNTNLVGDRPRSISTWTIETAPVENAPGWWLEDGSAFVEVGADGTPELLIYRLDDEDAAADYRLVAGGARFYLVHFDYQIALLVGAGEVRLSCFDADEQAVATSTATLASPDDLGTGWRPGLAGIDCPEATVELGVAFANSAFGDLRLRDLTLGVISPASPGFVLPEIWR